MKSPRVASALTTSLILIAVVAAVGVGWYLWSSRDAYDPLPKTFDENSEKLFQTVVVPTLDTPIPEGKSAIWCLSFQLAWNRLKDDVVKEPIVLAGAETVAGRLNNAQPSDKDVDPQSFYAAAGLARDGIEEKIRQQMAKKFPGVPVIDAAAPPDGAVAYAYLTARIKYKHRYNEGKRSFQDADGTHHPVGSFGFPERIEGTLPLREQAEVLFYYSSLMQREVTAATDVDPEFIVDLDRASTPDQLVVARIAQRQSLAEAMAYVRKKIASYPGDADRHSFGPNDSLWVPKMSWRVVHHFQELEGKHLANAVLQSAPLVTALQVIDLTMDSSATKLESQAKAAVTAVAKHCRLEGPYLLYLKKRNAEHPFFAMWVANAELCLRDQ